MGVLKGDFIGFTFNGVHTSDLGIIRISDGSRYNSNLLPTIQNKTMQAPGRDGTYFWDSNYTLASLPTVQIAFDSLTELQFRNLKKVFGIKNTAELIFDETPYKKYIAKVTTAPQLKFICFDGDDGQRIYKGEGSIQFTAFYPFAKSVHKFLNEYADEDFTNKDEWSAASGLKDIQGVYDKTGVSAINLYNAGDIETDFNLYISKTSVPTLTQIRLNDSEVLNFADMIINGDDDFIKINTKANLIEGCDATYMPTGTLYNKYIVSGDFFKIPTDGSTLTILGGVDSKIEYDYLYY